MRSSFTRLIRPALAVAPGAIVCAIVFFAQIFGKDSSLGLPIHVATESDIESIDDAQSMPPSAWRLRPRIDINTPSDTPISNWLKLDIPASSAPQGFVAEVTFSYFTDVEYFVVEHGKVVKHWLTGIGHPESFVDFPGLYFHMPFATNGQPVTLYVKTIGLGSSIAKVRVYSAETFEDICHLRDRVMGGLFGFSFMIILLNFAMFLTLRSTQYLLEIGTQSSLLAVVYFLEGYYKRLTPQFPWDHNLWIPWSVAFYLLALVFMFEFYRSTLQLDQNFPAMRRGYRFIYAMYACALIAVFSTTIVTGFAVALIVSVFSWAWLIRGHIRFTNLKSIFITFLGQSGGVSAIIATILTIFDILSDSLLNKSMAHIGIIWIGSSNLVTFGMRLILMEEKSRKIKMAMHSSHYRTELNRLLSSPYEQIENINQIDVTIMFVDIVSFSLLSAGRSASEIYLSLTRRLGEIITAIEAEGGSVDRSLGDGVLCYFAASNISSHKHHALAAFDAACTIQKETVLSANRDPDQLIMPVRIGVHSAQVIIGNLGDERHLDFTMIGSGVNFASRLESAASPFKINISQATFHHLRGQGLSESMFQPIKLSIKHQSSLVSAYEFDPTKLNPENTQRAETRFFEQIGVRREDQRHLLTSGVFLRLDQGGTHLKIEDFSRHGFRAVSNQLYGRRSTFMVQIETSSAAVNKAIAAHFLRKIFVEVRWSRQERDRFVHGLKIVGSSGVQRDFIYQLFLNHLSTSSAGGAASGAIDTSLVA